MSVQDVDLGWKHIVRQVVGINNFDVVVGWVEGQKDERDEEGDQAAGINNATLAAVHEFGTDDGHIPEGRLGFREWQDRNMSLIGDRIQSSYTNSIKEGGDYVRELNKLGLWAVSDWRKYQRNVQPGPEWSDSYSDNYLNKHGKKAFLKSKKLIDTGQLVNGATHQVRRKSL